MFGFLVSEYFSCNRFAKSEAVFTAFPTGYHCFVEAAYFHPCALSSLRISRLILAVSNLIFTLPFSLFSKILKGRIRCSSESISESLLDMSLSLFSISFSSNFRAFSFITSSSFPKLSSCLRYCSIVPDFSFVIGLKSTFIPLNSIPSSLRALNRESSRQRFSGFFESNSTRREIFPSLAGSRYIFTPTRVRFFSVSPESYCLKSSSTSALRLSSISLSKNDSPFIDQTGRVSSGSSSSSISCSLN